MVVLFQCLCNGREMQTFEAGDFNDIVLQPPVLCLERYDVVDVFEQARDGVCLRAVRLGHVPEHVGGGQAVPLYCQSKPHLGRVESRVFALSLLACSNFWKIDGARANDDRPLAACEG